MTFSIQPLPLDGPLFEGAIDVYSRAFALPPYSDPGRGEEIRSRMTEVHKDRAGFRAFCACIPGSDVVGMIYGYHGQPGQWWHDTVLRELERGTAARWLGDSYELVEVAVDPDYQDRGIGAMLIGHLLERVHEETCVLSTRTDSRAHNLYRRLGFEVITEMVFSPHGAPFYVMGRDMRLSPIRLD